MMRKILLKTNLLKQIQQKFCVFAITLFSLTLINFYGFGQSPTVLSFTTPSAVSLNATTWVTGTPYLVNQYVYSLDGTTNRLYKVSVAGTSTTQPTGTADVTAGATFAYMGICDISISTWTCPVGVNSVDVECWGAGGAGGTASTATISTTSRSGGGGGAGSYVKKTISVVPGTVYNLIIGRGGYKGGTNAASAYYGNLGGRSEFSGGGITPLIASGGTGGSGAGFSNLNTNPGGVLGGVYGFSLSGTYSTKYDNTSVVTLDNSTAGGTGAVTAINTSATTFLVTYIATTNQGSGYTSSPTVSVSPGAGQTFLAYANPNINSSGIGILTTLGSDGGVSSNTSGGAGGASQAGAGGAGGTGSVHGGYVGAAAPNVGAGGGGGFSYWTAGTGASASGGAGADGKIVITYTTTLPVKLTSFSGTPLINGNAIRWTTDNEVNVSHFELERSDDKDNFSKITEVKAGSNTYAFNDLTINSSADNSYYRLKTVDYDGSFEYSKIIFVRNTIRKIDISVYPNPFTENITIQSSIQPKIITINSVDGKFSKAINTSERSTRISLLGQSAGTYVISIKTSEGTISKVVVKQ